MTTSVPTSRSKNFLGDMSHIKGEGSTPPPAKTVDFHQTKTIFIQTLFLYCHPCLRVQVLKKYFKGALLFYRISVHWKTVGNYEKGKVVRKLRTGLKFRVAEFELQCVPRKRF